MEKLGTLNVYNVSLLLTNNLQRNTIKSLSQYFNAAF